MNRNNIRAFQNSVICIQTIKNSSMKKIQLRLKEELLTLVKYIICVAGNEAISERN